jgi:hypothetical protein
MLWYWLAPNIWRGVRDGLRTHFDEVVLLLAMAIPICVSYALIEGNLGTAYRHRAQVLPLFFMLGAYGITRSRAQNSTLETSS